MGDPLTVFIKEMLDAKQWSGSVDGEVREQLESDLRTRVLDQVDRAIIEALPEEKIDGMNELLDREASQEEIQQYVAESGVDVQRITLETMIRFRDLYLESGTSNEA